jgi:hypothetical protein
VGKNLKKEILGTMKKQYYKQTIHEHTRMSRIESTRNAREHCKQERKKTRNKYEFIF